MQDPTRKFGAQSVQVEQKMSDFTPEQLAATHYQAVDESKLIDEVQEVQAAVREADAGDFADDEAIASIFGKFCGQVPPAPAGSR